MALRGHCAQIGAASSFTQAYSGVGAIQAGDLIIVVTHQNGGTGAFTVTGPGATFTAGTALTPSIGGLINGNQWGVNVAIAQAGDAGTPTYSTTSTVGAGAYVQEIYVYSGRVNSSIAAAFSNSATTTPVSPGTSSTTFNMTGITALNGDDILICNPISPTTGTNQTFTTSATGYANALSIAQTSTNAPTMNKIDHVSASAGATGTIGVTVTATGGSGNNWFVGGFVLSLPSSSAYTFVHDSAACSTTSVNTLSTPAVTVTAGNFLIAATWTNGQTVTTVTDGPGDVFSLVAASGSLSVYVCPNALGGSTSVAFHYSGLATVQVYLAEYSGLGQSLGAVLGSSVATSHTGAAYSGGPVNATATPAMLWAMAVDSSSQVTAPVAAGGMTPRTSALWTCNTPFNLNAVADQTLSSPGNATSSFTVGSQFDTIKIVTMIVAALGAIPQVPPLVQLFNRRQQLYFST